MSQETLDDQTVLRSEGDDLMTFSGEIESKLPQTRKQERIVERSRLLADVLRPESVRRLCRRAGIQMYATKPTDDTGTVLKVLKQIADIFLFNLCKELNRLCAHLKKKLITEEILKESLRTLDVKLFGSCAERHKACETLKSRRNETGAETMRGSAQDIHHERNANDAPCVYFAASPFLRLLKLYLQEQATLERPLKPTPGVISCIQFLMEQTLLDILEKARYAMRQFFKKKANASPPGRTTLYARDIKVILVALAHRQPILRGKMRPVLEEAPPQSPRGGGSGSGASPKAKAKSKAKAKAKGGPARTKPAARAKKSGR